MCVFMENHFNKDCVIEVMYIPGVGLPMVCNNNMSEGTQPMASFFDSQSISIDKITLHVSIKNIDRFLQLSLLIHGCCERNRQ